MRKREIFLSVLVLIIILLLVFEYYSGKTEEISSLVIASEALGNSNLNPPIAVPESSVYTQQCGSGFCSANEFCCFGDPAKGANTLTANAVSNKGSSKQPVPVTKISASAIGFCCPNKNSCVYSKKVSTGNIPDINYCDFSKQCDTKTSIKCGTNCCNKETEWCSLQSISINDKTIPYFIRQAVILFVSGKKVGTCYPQVDGNSNICPSDKPFACGGSQNKPNACCYKQSDCQEVKNSSRNGVDFCLPQDCPNGYALARGKAGTSFGAGGIFELNICCDSSKSTPGNYPNGAPRCL